jgi:hypothetical protein
MKRIAVLLAPLALMLGAAPSAHADPTVDTDGTVCLPGPNDCQYIAALHRDGIDTDPKDADVFVIVPGHLQGHRQGPQRSRDHRQGRRGDERAAVVGCHGGARRAPVPLPRRWEGEHMTEERNTLIRILGLVNGGKTPYDGQYVVDYDASRPGREQWTGRPMLCHPYTFGDVTLIVQKGSNRYSCWYVLAEDGKYLSRGYDSQQAACAAASGTARQIRA